MLAHQHQTIEETDEERMSHEERSNRDENEKPKKNKLYEKMLDYWQISVKLLELSICIICSALVTDPLRRIHTSSYLHHFSLMFTTFSGYVLIITTLLLGRIFGDRLPFKTSFLFSLVGSGLFLTTGCLILSDRTDFSRRSIFHPNSYLLDMICTSGALAILNSFIMALDAIFTLKLQNDL